VHDAANKRERCRELQRQHWPPRLADTDRQLRRGRVLPALKHSTKKATVFAFPSAGAFTLEDLIVSGAGSSSVTWWGSQWAKLNSLSGGPAPAAFKGFAGVVTLPTTSTANICNGTWMRGSGDSLVPPATVPSYMGVIVPTTITKAGSTINGNYVKIVVVKTNPGYTPDPSTPGTGTIVATFCG
jgi:hypothetical protein